MGVYKRLQEVLRTIIAIALSVIMIVIFAQTFTRYVIFYSLPWSEELSRYLFVVMILLGIGVGISENLMVRIDIIDNFLSKKARCVFDIGRELMALVIASVFLYSTIDMIKIGSFQKSPAMQIPMNLMYTVLFVGFLFAVVSVLIRIIAIIKNTNGEAS